MKTTADSSLRPAPFSNELLLLPLDHPPATYTSVHCVDKDSLDMPKRTVLTVTTMMELEDSLI